MNSLHGRLAIAMALSYFLGVSFTFALDDFEDWIAPFVQGQFGTKLLSEPYQDIVSFIPFTSLACGFIWIVARWNLKRIKSASFQAELVGPENPGARISTDAIPREVRPLVNATNRALDRLAHAYASEQRFVSDAAHALRTPLAVLSLRLQRARINDAIDWHEVEGDLNNLTSLVTQLLDLARKENSRQSSDIMHMPIINLSRLAREVAASMTPLAVGLGRSIDVNLPQSLPVRGISVDLTDMIRNLLENAIRHGAGTIRLTGQILLPRAGRAEVSLTVSDDGLGVPQGLEEAVFERFRKADASSPGHGLGLAIVREVAQAHCGTASTDRSKMGAFRVTIPVAAPNDNLQLKLTQV